MIISASLPTAMAGMCVVGVAVNDFNVFNVLNVFNDFNVLLDGCESQQAVHQLCILVNPPPWFAGRIIVVVDHCTAPTSITGSLSTSGWFLCLQCVHLVRFIKFYKVV